MIQVPLDTEIKIIDPDKDIDVSVIYRCWMNEHAAMYPMEVTGVIHEFETLQEFIASGKKDYEKSYYKVDVVKVSVEEIP